jgi:hypothetical protein
VEKCQIKREREGFRFGAKVLPNLSGLRERERVHFPHDDDDGMLSFCWDGSIVDEMSEDL